MGTAMIETTADVRETTSRAWVDTPLLRFAAVEPGQSLAMAIIVRGIGDDPAAIEVLAPPLAPFSIIERPTAIIGRRATDQRLDGDASSTELWIRYDSTSPMAVDTGQVTIGHLESGRQWTIALEGTGILAKPTY